MNEFRDLVSAMFALVCAAVMLIGSQLLLERSTVEIDTINPVAQTSRTNSPEAKRLVASHER
ncbi:hypothetical protein I6F35_29435 [Bradyrhizobium sp. BRP22]|uniref:hypothetical protein n=1 Tax=Bradyrhizobium sp. BRP22 TaxID=2793821 RepID=UPI001CD53896|nr:hypothetical protein [Bradyrhizobium sp. BRP22]MCA1457284.1 hypothetical protein [Bradyrhizobium sp. BRP22]